MRKNIFYLFVVIMLSNFSTEASFLDFFPRPMVVFSFILNQFRSSLVTKAFANKMGEDLRNNYVVSLGVLTTEWQRGYNELKTSCASMKNTAQSLDEKVEGIARQAVGLTYSGGQLNNKLKKHEEKIKAEIEKSTASHNECVLLIEKDIKKNEGEFLQFRALKEEVKKELVRHEGLWQEFLKEKAHAEKNEQHFNNFVRRLGVVEKKMCGQTINVVKVDPLGSTRNTYPSSVNMKKFGDGGLVGNHTVEKRNC